MLANLSRREADLLIREQVPDLASIVTRRLGRVAYAVYGSPAISRSPTRRARRCAACPGSASTRSTTTCPARAWLLDLLERRPAGRARQQLAGPAGGGAQPAPASPCCPAISATAIRRCGASARSWRMSLPTNGCWCIATCATLPRVRAVMDALVLLFQEERATLEGRAPGRTASAANSKRAVAV